MIKVNLISRKTRASRGRNWTRVSIFLLFGFFGTYFVGVTLYVIISMFVIKGQTAKVNAEAETISNTMLANSDKLSRFVLTKLILAEMETINKDRFHYKDYLDQVSLLLPTGSSLTSVVFATKGWIAVTVNSQDIFSFGLLESSLSNKNNWLTNKYFSGAYIEQVTREKNGSYSTQLQLELKNING